MRTNSKQYRKDLADGAVIIANVCFNDECGNGHNTLSVTGELYDRDKIPGEESIINKDGKRRWLGSCGCLHDELVKHFPELREAIQFHLVSTDGPMHYVANTLYHAGDKDCHGSRKLEAARCCAIWPEATDEELINATAETLTARLPALMERFKAVVEKLGFEYTTEPIR